VSRVIFSDARARSGGIRQSAELIEGVRGELATWSVYANGSLLVGSASNSCPFLKLVPLIRPQTDLPEADANLSSEARSSIVVVPTPSGI
jgi:hypothetical protein